MKNKNWNWFGLFLGGGLMNVTLRAGTDLNFWGILVFQTGLCLILENWNKV